MDRKKFLKTGILSSAALVGGASLARAGDSSKSKKNQLEDHVGFNHLPNKESRSMKSVLHRADSRGKADHGWLLSHHSFSFANYYNPDRMHFGLLRVLNDDRVAPGKGFGTHPHDNMEIISIPLDGDLEHKDSMGNTAVIKEGDVQVMSAGTGIYHSEYNKNNDREVKFLQIWVFPNKRDVTPRYDQITLNSNKTDNNLYQILSPNQDDEGVWIHQNAWFHLGRLDKGKALDYQLKDPSNGVYIFVLEGDVQIGDQELLKRDGYGVWDTDELKISASSNARVLLMEVPMKLQ